MSTRKAIDPSTTSEHAQYETYKGTEDDWLGKIPAHWETARVQHVADVYPSSVDKRSSEDEQPVRLCNYTDVYYGTRINDASEFMEATATEPEIQTHELRSGDVLVTKDSEARDDIAVPALVTRDMPGVLCGYHLAQLRPTNRIHGSFLYYAFKTPSISTQFEAAATGITRYGLSVGALKKARLYLPPLPEQRAIAAYLDRETERIDTLIDKKERLIDLLEEKRTALISRAVTKGLDDDVAMQDSSIDWLDEIPAHWELDRLQWTVTACKNGYWGDSPEGDETDIVTVRVADFDRFELRVPDQDFTVRSVPPDKRDGRLLQPGDLLLEKSGGGDKQPVGAVMLYDLDQPAVCSNFIARMPVASGHNPSFLRYVHAALYEAGVNERAIKQSIGIQNLDADYYLKQQVPLPPLDEQRVIATYLDRETERIDALIDKIQDAIDRLKEYRTALISAAVTGQIDVREQVEGPNNLQ
jgi:type I restriction enzyme S subunit